MDGVDGTHHGRVRLVVNHVVRVHHRDAHDAQVNGTTRVDDEQLGGIDHVRLTELRRDFWYANYAAILFL